MNFTLQLRTNSPKGVFMSKDQGSNWQKLGPINDQVISLAVDSSNNIYAGTVSHRMFYSSDKGLTWKNVLIHAAGKLIKIKVSPKGNIYLLFINALWRKILNDTG